MEVIYLHLFNKYLFLFWEGTFKQWPGGSEPYQQDSSKLENISIQGPEDVTGMGLMVLGTPETTQEGIGASSFISIVSGVSR